MRCFEQVPEGRLIYAMGSPFPLGMHLFLQTLYIYIVSASIVSQLHSIQ